ncbi:MAG: hypothetical protein UX88_C0005G0027 [Candidatus Woesebacteria bacterium GW2011_GWC2_47_16]|uniref:Uncharacterized protein n=8 Tax=Candidatus Woeseibacteriota TaxID=1752722 RepID=A0A0G1SNU1_9BACT|nr:MAG: hypothetical protein UX34_C0001G0027 [Candidatus Woesebacteria bacterium GW2011_GWF1_46_13]KKU65217.1 MAG: hypothetical protein UX88_C0005G0027 [Candidatus Woesebacteria bacterium GW2011_GWC2_47_16]KKU71112.1 MAG: hypothetical protein UX95_C0004G0015 [Candidatus Woesebacteria bacterium GW2011_GWD1_47_21]OGM78014.1 MAG: hypothetical protein A2197_00555 [Candidatus Woesebacteria bacterium RIFOXYA1_FULL_48_16]OGM84455.1 MAG: hypothetical protein A2376_00425 [Candidatus Woesebacteria bacter
MSPETRDLFSAIKQAAVDTSRQAIEDKKRELEEALAVGDYPRIQETAQVLQQLSNLPEELADVQDPFASVLESRGIALDIPLEIFPVPTFEEPKELTAVERPVHHLRKPDVYIDDARAVAMQLLIKRGPKKKFIVRSLDDVAPEILREDRQNDRISIQHAQKYVRQTRKSLVESIRYESEKLEAKTMGKLISKKFGKDLRVTNPAWRAFYQEILQSYGQLSPEEFIDSVIYRFKAAAGVDIESLTTLSEISERLGIRSDLLKRAILSTKGFRKGKKHDLIVIGGITHLTDRGVRRLTRAASFLPEGKQRITVPSIKKTFSQLREVEAQEKEQQKRLIRKDDITPVDEIALCGLFLRKGVLAEIQERVLEGKDPEKVAREAGWGEKNCLEVFENSRDKMAEKRGGRPILEKEGLGARNNIIAIVNQLSTRPQTLQRLPREYPAVRFLRAIVLNVKPDGARILLNVFYPIRQLSVDSDGFIVDQTK